MWNFIENSHLDEIVAGMREKLLQPMALKVLLKFVSNRIVVAHHEVNLKGNFLGIFFLYIYYHNYFNIYFISLFS